MDRSGLRSRLCLALAPLLLVPGCGSASRAAHQAAMAADGNYAAAMVTGQALTTTLGRLKTPQGTPEDLQSRMQFRGGPERFRNPDLAAAREGLDRARGEPADEGQLGELRGRFESPGFIRLREAFRGAPEGVSFRGSVKDALGLEGATGEAVPVVDHPVLGQLLPAFAK